jgi:hypothetical protein
MSQTKKIRIQSRVDTATAWAEENPILLDKEIGYVRESGQYKIGDGETRWCDLPVTNIAKKVYLTIPNRTEDLLTDPEYLKLTQTIPLKDEFYMIEYHKTYELMDGKETFKDENGNPILNDIYLTVIKIGDGITPLITKYSDKACNSKTDPEYKEGLPAFSTVYSGEGAGSLV